MLYPPWWTPTALQSKIPSYLFVEYNDDDNLQAFVDTFNSMSQGYLDWFNSTPLSVYTSPSISGALLEWVAQGIYGVSRPYLPSGQSRAYGPLGTVVLGAQELGTRRSIGPSTYYATSDDVFKRILTWNLYRGDGLVYSTRWLKRRIARFLYGTNGTDLGANYTQQISISYGLNNQVNIDIVDGRRKVVGGAILGRDRLGRNRLGSVKTTFTSFPPVPNASILQAAVQAQVLKLPFEYTYVVNVQTGSSTSALYVSAGQLYVTSAGGFPTSPAGLYAGALWSNSGLVTVVAGGLPSPIAPPLYYSGLTPSLLLSVGGASLTISPGASGSGQLYLNPMTNAVQVS